MTSFISSTREPQLSVHIPLLVVQTSVGANQFHFDFALLAGLDLISGSIKENVLLSEVLRDLGERAKQFGLCGGKDDLSSSLLAQLAQLLIVGVFNHTGGGAFEVLCADAEDGNVIALSHLDRVSQRALACGIFAVRQYDYNASRVRAFKVGHFLFDDPIHAIEQLGIAA